MSEYINENNYLIWDLLASNNSLMSINKISEETGIEPQYVRISLAKLCGENLLQKIEKNTYKINKILTALQWAKAVELGVDIELLEKYAKLETNQDEALLVTIDGTLEQHDQNIKEEKRKVRIHYLEGKAATEAAKTDLAKIVSDTEFAIKDAENLHESVKEILFAANDEAKSALQTLITNYVKRRN